MFYVVKSIPDKTKTVQKPLAPHTPAQLIKGRTPLPLGVVGIKLQKQIFDNTIFYAE